MANVLATGGINRLIQANLTNPNELSFAASGSTAVITCITNGGGTAAWAVTPSVGDALNIPSTSVIKGAASANEGWYIVTAATSNTINVTAISTVGALVNVAATDVTASDNVDAYSPVVLQNIGGLSRNTLTGIGSFNISTTYVSGSSMVITSTVAWPNLPQVNDLLHIPAGSDIVGAANANVGWWTITAVTATTITVTRLSNGLPAASVSPTPGSSSDFDCQRPSIPGVGKTLELFDGGGAVNMSTEFLTLANAAVSFLSTPATPVILTSASEQDISLQVQRISTSTNVTLTPNNLVCLSVGYNGTTATLTIGFNSTAPQLSTTVTGGVGSNLSFNPVTLQLQTIGQLAAYINAQPGYTCSVATALAGQLPVVALNTLTNAYQWTLDQGTFGICSGNGGQAGRIKDDAYAFFNVVNSGTSTVFITGTSISNSAVPQQPAAGLPDPVATLFLGSGVGGVMGATGGTSNANVTNALAACQYLTANFVVPLFSQNATADIAAGLTDPSSTYTIASINAAVLNHVLLMSTILQKGNRQGFCSNRSTFANDLTAAANLASYRISLAFQDQKVVDQNGNLTQFQPWMGSVLAASMQAAGFYRSIMRKQINTSGVLQNVVPPATAPDFQPNNKAQLTQALLGGLLVAQPATGGGFNWVSDQTTYGVDNNFVFNSIQCVYDVDLCALTIQQRMEALFVGQSLADVSASVMLSALQSIMADLKRLKLIAPSSDAPAGYLNASVQIQGYTAVINVEIKPASALAFIPITVSVSQVTQSATTST
jgi:hypothetical protein